MSNNEKERMLYEMRAKAIKDEISALEQSREEGQILAQKKVAIKMIAKGSNNEDIMDLTDLTEEIINELRDSED